MIGKLEKLVRAAALASFVVASLACGGGGDGTGGEQVEVQLGATGPGDAANHLPLDVGNEWFFLSSGTDLPGQGTLTRLAVAEQRDVGPARAAVIRETVTGETPSEWLLVPDANGVANLGSGDPADPLGPYWEIRYPLEPGSSYVQLDRKKLSYGADLDGDGKDETLDVRAVARVMGKETATVPAGTFADCARVEWTMTLDLTLSRDGRRVRATSIDTAWLAPGVGWVRRTQTFSAEGVTDTREHRLVAYSVAGRSARITLRATPSTLSLSSGSTAPVQVVAVGLGGEEFPVPATWVTSNSSVARIEGVPVNGATTAWVTAGVSGTATVMASFGPAGSNGVTVTVGGTSGGPTLRQITLNPSSATVAVGGSATLSATAYDTNGYWTSVSTYTWTSSDQAVATVDATGKVTGVAPGTATVTAAAGGATSAPVTITVSALRALALPANDLVHDPTRARLYASVPSRHGVNGNSVAVIDPATRTVESYVWVGSEPSKLALSGDGRYLYVGLDGAGSVARLDLQHAGGPTVDLTFSLGTVSSYGQRYAADIAVMPGAPQTVAISLRYGSVSPSHAGVAVYDDGVQRPNVTAGHTGSNAIEFSASPSILYGLNNETTEFGFRRMTVDANGVSVLTTDAFASGFSSDIAFAGGRIFSSSGGVYDPEARQLLGTFTGLGYSSILEAQPAGGRVLFVTGSSSYSGPWTLKAYDRTTFVPLGSETLPGVSGTPRDLVRWGTKGVAFRTAPDYGNAAGDRVYFLETTVAGP